MYLVQVLDVGPFKTHGASDQANSGDVYPDPYIYTMADKTPRGSQEGTTHAQLEHNNSGQLDIDVSNFEESLVKL